MPGEYLWFASWGRGVLLVMVTSVMHATGLGLIGEYVVPGLRRLIGPRHRMIVFVAVLGTTVILITMLHGLEAAAWAAAYRILDALPDWKTAMLYSLEAMTSYGHIEVELADRWMMMGAIEALNGMMLLGLTTATLLAIVARTWPPRDRPRYEG